MDACNCADRLIGGGPCWLRSNACGAGSQGRVCARGFVSARGQAPAVAGPDDLFRGPGQRSRRPLRPFARESLARIPPGQRPASRSRRPHRNPSGRVPGDVDADGRSAPADWSQNTTTQEKWHAGNRDAVVFDSSTDNWHSSGVTELPPDSLHLAVLRRAGYAVTG